MLGLVRGFLVLFVVALAGALKLGRRLQHLLLPRLLLLVGDQATLQLHQGVEELAILVKDALAGITSADFRQQVGRQPHLLQALILG